MVGDDDALGGAFAGKYRIECILGSGGMGTVLRAHHIQLDRPVAIKVMHGELLAVDDAARRFSLEARATAVLKSAHAVRILDIDRAPSGAPFIVMELLEGSDLAAIVAERGPLTVERAIHYLLQATDAIAEAHGHGIIHRDLKPQNMFLTTEGVVKVLDFGLAKALRPAAKAASVPDSARTGMNVMVGSPSYMSPEQIWSGHVVDQRTDIWGLGATLYHLLAGGPPFPAPDMHVLSSHIALSDPPRIAGHRDDVSASVDDVIARCLKKKPEERYPTIAAFQGALLHLRVELQTRSAFSTAGPGSTTPGSTTPGSTTPGSSMGATLPATTRRVPPAGAPWQGDDEPTQIDDEPTQVGTSVDVDLASTRKA